MKEFSLIKLFRKYSKKRVLGVIILQYAPFLISVVPPKIIFKSRLYMQQICGVTKNLKHFKYWYFFTASMIKPP